MEKPNYKIVRKVILKKKKKRNIKYLFDIVKLIKSKPINELFKYLDNTNNKKDLYEKILSILIKCYSNDLLNVNNNDNLEDYFKNNSKMKNNILVFISSKYNDIKNDINNDINNDIKKEKIIKINKYKRFYKKYNIVLFVKNRNKILEVIKNSKDSNYDITDIINNILDYNDFKKYYSKLHNELLNIDLNITGEFNKKFNNTNLIKKFEQITI